MKVSRYVSGLVFVISALLLLPSAMAQTGFKAADSNNDGGLDRDELKTYVKGKLSGFKLHDELFDKMDGDKNGSISTAEFEKRMEAVQAIVGGETAKPTGNGNSRNNDKRGSLKVGEMAPTFVLDSLKGDSRTDLTEFRKKKPVVLIFGSYT